MSPNEQEEIEAICVRLPASLMREVRILLLDPTYGRIKYRALRYLIMGLLTEWLEKKKKKLETVGSEEPSEDRFEIFDKDGL